MSLWSLVTKPETAARVVKRHPRRTGCPDVRQNSFAGVQGHAETAEARREDRQRLRYSSAFSGSPLVTHLDFTWK